MATEKQLLDANEAYEIARGSGRHSDFARSRADLTSLQEVFEDCTTVDAVPMDDMKEFAEDVVYQFGYYGQYNGRLHIGHGGLSTLEWAFDILGWDNPHPVPEFECEIDGCHEHATCGAPTSDGYKRMCGKHYAERRTNERKAD